MTPSRESGNGADGTGGAITGVVFEAVGPLPEVGRNQCLRGKAAWITPGWGVLLINVIVYPIIWEYVPKTPSSCAGDQP
jgi:hypothetical protein